MSRSSRIRRRRMAGGDIVQTPNDWLEMDTGLPPEMADNFVRDLRAAGAAIWLIPDPDLPGNVRTRIMLPGDIPQDEHMLHTLARYARDIGKAVARSGEWNPPPDNPWGDRPLPPGGTWDWFGK